MFDALYKHACAVVSIAMSAITKIA